ncbi:MAG: DUF1559 domain-containing protein [Gemmatales bacterium]|nr:DUF1559 domain-containing protein [Gemmatales bacterium]MDW7995562.1 DUF1559 domain-containing protein [Gemmatales bacterium]
MLVQVRRRWGFTLVELLVVIAIIGLLLALLLPAIQRVREAANVVRCKSNLNQLALATHNFHNDRLSLPAYFGVHPGNGLSTNLNNNQPFGSWFLHLLPYLEYQNLYEHIETATAYFGTNQGTPSGCTNVCVQWETRQVQTTQCTCVQWQTTTCTNPGQNWNGHHAPPTTYQCNQCVQQQCSTVTVTQNVCTQYQNQPNCPYGGTGIWATEARLATFPNMLCPSDPSAQVPPGQGRGRVYTNPGWGSTNYLANWHAFAHNPNAPVALKPQPVFNGPDMRFRPPLSFAQLPDGLSQTVFYAEAYASCDTIGRIALYSWYYHNFGLSWFHEPNTEMFQVRPLPRDFARCPAGYECCNNWTVQTPHNAINVALGDGSVRSIRGGIAHSVWYSLLVPYDDQPVNFAEIQ